MRVKEVDPKTISSERGRRGCLATGRLALGQPFAALGGLEGRAMRLDEVWETR